MKKVVRTTPGGIAMERKDDAKLQFQLPKFISMPPTARDDTDIQAPNNMKAVNLPAPTSYPIIRHGANETGIKQRKRILLEPRGAPHRTGRNNSQNKGQLFLQFRGGGLPP